MTEIALIAGLIDESGSMADVRNETISGFNSFLAAVQAEQAGKEAYALGWTFDHHPPAPVLRPFCDGPLALAVPLSEATYTPRGFTPLYDAIGGAIARIDALVAEKSITKVTFMIQTDGAENMSREYAHAAVRAAIEARQKLGWQIIFLGADLKDARSTGTGLGVMAANSMRYDKSSTGMTFNAMATATSAYRGHDGAISSDMMAVNLSDEQKAAFGDVPDPSAVPKSKATPEGKAK